MDNTTEPTYSDAELLAVYKGMAANIVELENEVGTLRQLVNRLEVEATDRKVEIAALKEAIDSTTDELEQPSDLREAERDVLEGIRDSPLPKSALRYDDHSQVFDRLMVLGYVEQRGNFLYITDDGRRQLLTV